MCKLKGKTDETSFDTWLEVFWWWTANWCSTHHLYFFVGPPQSSWKSKLEGIQDKVQDCTVVFRGVGTQLFLAETTVFGLLMDKQWYEFWSFLKPLRAKIVGQTSESCQLFSGQTFRGMQEVEELLRSLKELFGWIGSDFTKNFPNKSSQGKHS